MSEVILLLHHKGNMHFSVTAGPRRVELGPARPSQPWRLRWQPRHRCPWDGRSSASASRRATLTAEGAESDGADSRGAGGAGRSCGWVPEAGSQCWQAASRSHQTGVWEEEPEVSTDTCSPAQEAGTLSQEAEGDWAGELELVVLLDVS